MYSIIIKYDITLRNKDMIKLQHFWEKLLCYKNGMDELRAVYRMAIAFDTKI